MDVVAIPADVKQRNKNIAANVSEKVWPERQGQIVIDHLGNISFYGVTRNEKKGNAGRGVQVKLFDAAIENDKGRSLGIADSRDDLEAIILRHLEA